MVLRLEIVMDYVEIQIQVSGIWQTCRSCPNDSQYILCEMKNVKNIYPDLRVRAADKDGRLIDMLG
jgi:hypothetical protein